MKTAKVRMLIIDEIHHILVGKADERIRILNGLKFLSTELQIPIVLIGTIEAMRTIQTNQQLGNRFESFHIPRWENGEEYARFLSGCGAATTIGKGAWQSKKFVTRFHSMAEGMTGETWKLMCKAAFLCVTFRLISAYADSGETLPNFSRKARDRMKYLTACPFSPVPISG